MEKITKSMKYKMIEDILATVENDNAEMLIEFVKAEQAALANKAAKAKERAAEKKTERDELCDAVLGVLTSEPMTRDEVFALVENTGDEITVAKVGARLTKLVGMGLADKVETKAVSASGKKTTRMAYTLALTDAEPVEVDE